MVKAPEGMYPAKRIETEILGPRASLEKTAIQTTLHPEHALDPNIQEIDLGRFNMLGDRMARQTLRDPRHLERQSVLRVKESPNRIRLYKQRAFKMDSDINTVIAGVALSLWKSAPIVVSKEDETFTVNIASKPGDTLVSSYHTHPLETPPSIPDLMPLFLSNEHRKMFAFVSTVDFPNKKPGRKYLVFRGQNTPQISLEAAQALFAKYEELFEPDLPNGEKRPNTKQRLLKGQGQREEDELLLFHIAKEYDLRVFIAPAGQKIAKLVDLDNPTVTAA